MQDPDLWARLETVETQPLAEAVARRARWGRLHAATAADELRRYLYLTQISEGRLEPPTDLAIAWTAAAGPARAPLEAALPRAPRIPAPPAEERPATGKRYDKARGLYAREFGAEPPRAIWRTEADAAAMQGWLRRSKAGYVGFLAALGFLIFAQNLGAALFAALAGAGWLVFAGLRASAYGPQGRRKAGAGGAEHHDRDADGANGGGGD